MEYKDKIYFLEDVLDEYEKKGGDKEAAEAMYWYFLDKLSEEVKKSDEVVFKIPKFGNLYYTISSLHGLKQRFKRDKKHFEKKSEKKVADIQDNLYIVDSKIKKINHLVQRAIANKVNNIWFFRKRFNLKNVKNG